ncbi:glycoside hydrolase [Aspergillus niger]|nr:glycoside hydrolase [Aspergillus niger]
MVKLLPTFLLQAGFALAAVEYLNWTTYIANGGADDEWGLCVNQGSQCGPILERRYATYITTSDIDTLANAGVNTLRIPTTYAAWVKVPGSQLYSGNQVSFLNNIATYAITRYSMHIIIDVHSLPGGVNGKAFGEATGHYGWFNNQTALDYSLQAIDSVIAYIQNSSNPGSYTIEPINEPVDNKDMSAFGSPEALSDEGAAWVLKYIQAVLDKVEVISPDIPVMFQGSFRGEEYWSPNFSTSANLVFDVHNYYFAGRGATGKNITTYICADAKNGAGDGKFPVFVGEWSIQAQYNNSFADRDEALNTGLYASAKDSQGSAYWNAKFSGNATVDGQGTQADYWNYMTWIDNDMIHPDEASGVCA